MARYQAWLENKVDELRPGGTERQSLGDLGAVEQLARAWQGLDGQGSSVFGMASTAAFVDVDFDRVKGTIVNALESWLACLVV